MKRKEFLERLANIPIEYRIYLDESGINKYLYRTHARSMRGKKVVGEVSGMRYARERVLFQLYTRENSFAQCVLKGLAIVTYLMFG